eukprot:XP_011679884.1 PREDICTED: palmitoyltransferase ZDHHC23 isoform X2 [Strongylocentrotus purpuratus]
MKDETGDPLCCCEFINGNGERSHLLAVFCDCEDLDESCDRFFTGRDVGRDRVAAVKETILDRVRIPTFLGQGARRIDELVDTTALPPLFVIPFWLYIASFHVLLTAFSFIIPLGAVVYYLRVLKHKQRTQFFMSVTLVSIFSMYYVFSLYAVPIGDVSAVEHAAISINLLLFFGAFAMTKRAAGFVDCNPTSSESSTGPRDGSESGGQRFADITHLHKRNNGSSNSLYESEESDSSLERGPLIGQSQENEQQRTNETEGSIPTDWCNACQMVKPARAGHCRICDRCVHRLDHHCVWLDCCIGRDNHRSFIIALLLFFGGGCWGAGRGTYTLLVATQYEESFWTALEYVFLAKGLSIIFVSILYALLVCPAVLALLLQQFHLITHNWTYRERRLVTRQPGGRERLMMLDKGAVTNWVNFITNCGDLDETGDGSSTVV